MIVSVEIARRILDRVGATLNRQVSVTDRAGHVLASTDEQLLGMLHPLAKRAINAEATVEVEDGQSAGLGLPLVYADAIVGALVLADVSREGREFARLAKTLAELIIHQMSVIEHLPQQKWVRDTFISDLLHGRLHGSEEVMLHEANILGIDLNVPRFVAVVTIKPLVDQHIEQRALNDSLPKIAHALRLEQFHTDLLARLQAVVTPYEADIWSFIDDHHLILLAVVNPADPNKRRQQVKRDIQRFLDTSARAGDEMSSAGIGWYHPGWLALAQSCSEAGFALETGRGVHGPGHVCLVEDLGLAGFVRSDDWALKAELTRRVLEPLAPEPELLATLDVFLRENLSPSLAAQALHVHRHTLAYRLDKIAHLTGLNPRTFDAAAQLAAALVVQKTTLPSM
jgi:carbohydrate diacid regulator